MGNHLENLTNCKVHMVGIGGISMSGLCEILMSMGVTVTGSDSTNSPNVERLKLKNVPVFLTQEPSNITDQKMVIYTAAVSLDHPELAAARERGIPVIDRASLLGEIMSRYEKSIAVSGTHGKTTTTSMISSCLLEAGRDPTVHIGGILDSIGGNTRIGKSPYFITEACEYKDSFLKFHPFLGIILNIESDHLDYFNNLEHIVQSFRTFAGKIPESGFCVGNSDDAHVAGILEKLNCQVVSYGLTSSKASWTARNISFDEKGLPSFSVVHHKKGLLRLKLNVPGLHNVSNSLACFAACNALGLPTEKIRSGLRKYTGAHRRYEHKGMVDGIQVIDDYAHHPTEIIATLKAARGAAHGKILCVFQPHTYSRTLKLINEFAHAFTMADKVYLTDIYAAREKNTGLINSSSLVDKINRHMNNAVYIPTFKEMVERLIRDSSPGDIILTMGAGNVDQIGDMFLLEKKTSAVG